MGDQKNRLIQYISNYKINYHTDNNKTQQKSNKEEQALPVKPSG